MIKIAHIADVQVKNRDKNLYVPYYQHLKYIVQKLDDNKDIQAIVLAGDLFEYCNPNDSERKLIYNFISELINVKHLEKIIVLAGNHDLEKSKKSQGTNNALESDINIGHNALNIFVDVLNTLDEDLKQKLVYINQSKVYSFNINKQPVNIIGYSLEDDMNIRKDDLLLDNNSINICVFHAMLKEYVDSANLPLRKDIYSSLLSIEEFPANTIIMAGDIHENLHYTGIQNQQFYYPGSTQQHTHNEGSYFKISDSIIEKSHSECKGINLYEILDNTSHSLTRIPIKDFVRYITLELDLSKTYSVIKPLIEQWVNDEKTFFGEDQTYIKVKTSNCFASKEQEIFQIINKINHDKFDNKNFKISFEYEKLKVKEQTQVSSIVQEVIQSVIENQTEESENTEEYKDIVISSDNIDKLVLSDENVIKLFGSVIKDQLNKDNISDDIDPKKATNDIITLFSEQLSQVSSTSKKYSLVLKDIYCNQFMALGQNKVNLDIPGIIRILGTNGIGKTTLFRMIRWVLTGEVFEGMKSNTVAKNNMIVFNSDLVDNDVVIVRMNVENNNIPVLIERTCVRKWKNNTTRDQKISIDWKDYAIVERSIKFIINPGTENEKIVIGDNAESNIKLWIGEAVDNILFINQFKIDKLLKSSGKELNEMILSFIGVDYIQKLEDNLDTVKTDLMSVSKPIVSKNDIRLKLNELDIQKTKLDNESINIKNQDKTEIEANIVKIDDDLSLQNSELLKIGDIPTEIDKVITDISTTKNIVDNFIVQEEKPEIPFDQNKPILDMVKLTKLAAEISNEKSNIETLNSSNKEFNDIIKDQKENINNDFKSFISKIDEAINNITIEYNELLSKSQKIDQDIIQILNDEKLKFSEKYNVVKNELVKALENIQKNKLLLQENLKNIESGVCPTCKRPLADDFETHKNNLLKQNQELEKTNELIQTTITELNEYSDKLKIEIDYYNKFISNISSLDDTFDNEKIKTLLSEKSDINNSLSEKSNKKILLNNRKNELFEYSSKIHHSNDIKQFETSIKIPDDISPLIESLKNNLIEVDNFNKNIIKSEQIIIGFENDKNQLNSEYTSKLQSYQSAYEYNIKENNSIKEFNLKVKEHNDSLQIHKNNLKTLEFELLILQNQKLDKYNYIKDLIKALTETRKNLYNKLENLNYRLTEIEVGITNTINSIKDYNDKYEQYLKYESNQFIWKIYSKVIKTQFKNIIFEYYRTFLNNTLNDMLENINFKLFWDSQSELYMMRISNGEVIYIPINQVSGMESIFCGLALIYTISLLNIKNSISHILIDELSGQLSKGDLLSYHGLNYQELFILILNKFENKTILIVDHNIKNMNESQTYEVVKGDNGNLYVSV